MSYRNDLAALSARKSALEVEVRDRQRELAEASRLVEEVEARRKLPVLDNIRVAAPCPARWADMVGDDRTRACAQCDKNVYNLSDMTRDEAQALIIEKEGKLCVRYFQRADGTILLKDCAIGVRRRRRRRVVAAGVAASLAGAAFGLLRSQETLGGVEDERMIMGEVRAMPPSTPDPWVTTEEPSIDRPVAPDHVYEVAGAIAPMAIEPAPIPAPVTHGHTAPKFAKPPLKK